MNFQALTFILLLASPVQDQFQWPAVTSAERAVLMELFHATGGEEWVEKDGWGTDAPVC